MVWKASNYVGERFGRLKLLRRVPPDRRKILSSRQEAMWECECDCGSIVIVGSSSLNSKKNRTRSCGCLRRELASTRNFLHGWDGTRLQSIWASMHHRCRNKKDNSYKNYGGRGITVCSAWQDFVPFRDWALVNGYEDDLTIERIDVNGHYEPDNCTWIPGSEQAKNRRNTLYAPSGDTLADYCKKIKIPYATVWARLARGLSIEQALITTYQRRSKKIGVEK